MSLSFSQLRSFSREGNSDEWVMKALLSAITEESWNDDDVVDLAGELFLRGYSSDQFLSWVRAKDDSHSV